MDTCLIAAELIRLHEPTILNGIVEEWLRPILQQSKKCRFRVGLCISRRFVLAVLKGNFVFIPLPKIRDGCILSIKNPCEIAKIRVLTH